MDRRKFMRNLNSDWTCVYIVCIIMKDINKETTGNLRTFAMRFVYHQVNQ